MQLKPARVCAALILLMQVPVADGQTGSEADSGANISARVERAAKPTRAYKTRVHTYLPPPDTILHDFRETTIEQLLVNPIEECEVLVHPEYGVLLDRTNPLIRQAQGRKSLSIFLPTVYIEILGVSKSADRKTIGGIHELSGPSNYLPTGASLQMRRHFSRGGTSAVERRSDGTLAVPSPRGQSVFLVSTKTGDPDAYYVSHIEGLNGATDVVFVGDWGTPVCSSPMTKYKLHGRPLTGGGFEVETVMAYDKPVLDGPISKKDFDWWEYVPKAIDRSTGDVYGPGDVRLDVPPVPKTRPVKESDRTMTIDPATVKAAEQDPTARVLPKVRGNRYQSVLLAIGITCLVAAIGWKVRR